MLQVVVKTFKIAQYCSTDQIATGMDECGENIETNSTNDVEGLINCADCSDEFFNQICFRFPSCFLLETNANSEKLQYPSFPIWESNTMLLTPEDANLLCASPTKKCAMSTVRTVEWLFAPAVLSHVVGVLQIYYLLSCVDGWLSQHGCVVATVILYNSHLACLA